MDSVNVTNIMPTNVANTLSVNCHIKKVRYKMDYILLAVLLVTILLFIISIICHHNKNHRSKQKNIGTLTI